MIRKLVVLVFGAAFLLSMGLGCKESAGVGTDIKDGSKAPEMKKMTPGGGGGGPGAGGGGPKPKPE
jgi:predicted small secreted protein